jgi:transcriptional regulator with XRE-family HTH domain
MTRGGAVDQAVRVEPLLRRLVGAILRERREAQRRTLRDVADAARVSVAYLSEVERGRKEASSEVLGAVCRALGMRLVDLVGAAHAELATTEGRVVLDLTAPTARRSAAASRARAARQSPAAETLLLAA